MRRHVFNYQNWQRQRVVMAFWCSGFIRSGACSAADCGVRQREFTGGYDKAANQAAGLSFAFDIAVYF